MLKQDIQLPASQKGTHRLVSEAAEMLKKVARASCASALASSVLPLPAAGQAAWAAPYRAEFRHQLKEPAEAAPCRRVCFCAGSQQTRSSCSVGLAPRLSRPPPGGP